MSQKIAQDLEKTSRVIRAGRKLRGITQVELASALGVSQSVISKYESGFLMPDASFWFRLCDLVNIDAHYSFQTGLIYNHLGFKKEVYPESTFKLPTEYTQGPLIKNREVFPFISCLKEINGNTLLEDFLKKKKLDEDLFIVQDYQLSLKLLLDLAAFAEKSVSSTQLAINASKKNYELTQLFKTDFEKILKSEKRSCQFTAVVDYFKIYDQVFEYKIEHEKDTIGVVLEFRKRAEVNSINESDLNWYKHYKTESIKYMVNHAFKFNVHADYNHSKLVAKLVG